MDSQYVAEERGYVVQTLKFLFQEYDGDGDGVIDQVEFSYFLWDLRRWFIISLFVC